MTGYADVLLLTAAVVATLMLSLWVVSLILRDASIVDPFWGLGFVAVAWASFLIADGSRPRQVLLVALVTIWGVRLSAYLFWRNHGTSEDYRYADYAARTSAFFPRPPR
jgi:steroid 5-alpha reductase family enzyme